MPKAGISFRSHFKTSFLGWFYHNVMLVADNQLNHLYGDPIWLRTGLTDKLVKVAIRPVQQDIFGQDLLRWALEVIGKRRPVIGERIAQENEYELFELWRKTGKLTGIPKSYELFEIEAGFYFCPSVLDQVSSHFLLLRAWRL